MAEPVSTDRSAGGNAGAVSASTGVGAGSIGTGVGTGAAGGSFAGAGSAGTGVGTGAAGGSSAGAGSAVGAGSAETGSAVGDGFRRLARIAWLVFPLQLANLLVALFAVLPLYAALHRITAHRPAAGRLITTWDLEILAEIAWDHPALMESLLAVFLFVPLFYVLLSQLLVAGALGALHRAGACMEEGNEALRRPTEENPSRSRVRATGGDFGRDALTHFLPMVRLLVWSLVPFALSAGVLLVGYSVAETWTWPLRLLMLLPGLFLVAWTDAALDFARAYRILGAKGSAVVWLLWGYGVVLRRPLAALGLHLGFGLAGLVPLLVLVSLPGSLDAGGTWPVLLAFLIRQGILILRLALRLASLGAHLSFAQAVPNPPGTAQQWPPVPQKAA